MLDPDGARVATASRDGTTRIWEVITGKTIATLTGHTDTVNAVVFRSDGTRLATGSDDHSALIWNAEAWSVDPYHAACDVIGGVSLTREEWSRYVPDVPFRRIC